VLADDHQIFRRGLRQLLDEEPTIEVVAEAANGVEALAALAAHRPHVLLLDLSMPVLDGLRTLPLVLRDHPTVGVVLLTVHHEPAHLLQALDAGPHGLVSKDADAEQIVSAVRAVAAGHAWLEPRATALLLGEYRRLRRLTTQVSGQFTSREITLLRLVASGHSNKEIAGQLGVAESTVKNWLGNLFDRLGVPDRTQAALYAFSHGILDSGEPRA
jgi:DNA-binding NarL/FixJ family response regulator